MLANGDVFAGYVIDRQLGRGGMGSVYLAKHPRLPRMTALKLLNREMFFDKEVRARFEREADLVAQLDHPNIVTVYDRGLEDEQLWISMQYIDGIDAASVDPLQLPPERAVQIVAETASALDYAHGMGVLHRDVKPANILLARSTGGKGERVYLTDFGIARLRDDTGHLTQTGTFTATLAYASPEQLTGSQLDGRSDQYSLACTLFWLLTGNGPFAAANPAAVIQGHLQSPPPPVSTVRPGLPQALDGVLTKAMSKRPEDRYPSCSDFATAARQALSGVSSPAMPVAGPTTAAPYPSMGAGYSSGVQQQSFTGGSQAQPYASGLQPQPAPAPPYGTDMHQQQFAGGTQGYTHQGMSGPSAVPQQPPGVMSGSYPHQGYAPSGAMAPGPGGPRKSNTGLIVGIVVAVVVLLVVAVGIVATVASNDSGGGSTASGSSTSRVSTAAPVPATADSISKEFPNLVPASTSEKVGYNNADCWDTGPSYAPNPDDGEPDFGKWKWQWRCFGGNDNDDPFYRIYVYESAADVESVIQSLPAEAEKSTDTNGGKTYTNYRIDNKNGPQLVTVFTGDPNRAQFLMYTDGIVGSLDEVLTWWRSAPLN
ncbi:serine/threonine-protein kinase [Nocardia paucivorans]|uniref:serine/threonine-protein kinase n=1 Tax=Nocardia paucivorans TaxID=114259 RepID=UPI0002F5C9C4|nr:serine/threonine-protein kinase [Nocardia paucivorans]